MSNNLSDLNVLAQDIELVRLRLLGAFSPRAAAARLKKVGSRLQAFAQQAHADSAEVRTPVKPTNGNGHHNHDVQPQLGF